jgi:hypothetical protein
MMGNGLSPNEVFGLHDIVIPRMNITSSWILIESKTYEACMKIYHLTKNTNFEEKWPADKIYQHRRRNL